MTSEQRTRWASGADRAPTTGDPPGMTEAEKRIAEWEARHDVAARGHWSPPDVLQHYLAHERLVHERFVHERVASGQGRHPVDPVVTDTGGPTEREPSTPFGNRRPAGAQKHSLVRRLFRRRS